MEFGKKDLEEMINTRDNILMIKNGDLEFLLGPLETFIREIIMEMSEMDMVKCIGPMEVIIRENGLMVFNMEKVTIIII
jgi:hypothetical protein